MQKRRLQSEINKKADVEEKIDGVRQEHTECVGQHGKLLGEQEAHNQQVTEREQLIDELGEKHKIKSSDYSSSSEFIACLDELRRRQTVDLEKLQVCCVPSDRRRR